MIFPKEAVRVMKCNNCGQDNPPEASFCANCGASLVAISRPSLNIGVFSSYGHGWQQLWKYFLELFLIGLIGFVIGIPAGMGGWGQGAGFAFLGVLGTAYGILLVSPVDYGVSFSYLKAARGDKLEINNVLEAFSNYWNAVLAGLLVGIIVFIGFILLIIPGIIFACKLAFVPYLVVDRKMEVIEAIRGSWNMTNGHAWKVFLIGLLGIPIFIAGLICFVVGVILSIMWIRMAFASLYYSVSYSK